jgi:hypothetical protein
MRRVLVILLVALALSPGLFWRDAPVTRAGPQPLYIAQLPLEPGTRVGPNLVLAGAWELDSRSADFGGYSALVPLPGGELLALSDRGRVLRFDPRRGTGTPLMHGLGSAEDSDKRSYDVESATRDPRGGAIWLGYEGRNAISRLDPALQAEDEVRPADMRHWPANRGPEAMARLADSRFIVLSEAVAGWQRPASEGLLFGGDPVEGAAPERFRFLPPAGFRPTDMAQLPDGRVLILLRKIEFGLPPRLASRLVAADPATIKAGEEWAWRPFAEIAAPLPPENYEGLAVETRADGAVRLWLIADDNSAAFQRTLLLALDWTPETTRAHRTARPSKSSEY